MFKKSAKRRRRLFYSVAWPGRAHFGAFALENTYETRVKHAAVLWQKRAQNYFARFGRFGPERFPIVTIQRDKNATRDLYYKLAFWRPFYSGKWLSGTVY